MKINNPKVTLADEARNGVEEEVRSGFLDWLYEFNVEGDDGELYALGGSILFMNLEKLDLVTICMARGKGSVRQLTGGRGTMSIRQWHAYPNILPKELYNDEVRTGEKFATL